jgi:hypothetical protein
MGTPYAMLEGKALETKPRGPNLSCPDHTYEPYRRG